MAVFNGAVGWLRGLQVLQASRRWPGSFARERDAATTLHVWTKLAQSVSGGQARLLRGLLVVPEGSRRSELDRLRKAESVTSGAEDGPGIAPRIRRRRPRIERP